MYRTRVFFSFRVTSRNGSRHRRAVECPLIARWTVAPRARSARRASCDAAPRRGTRAPARQSRGQRPVAPRKRATRRATRRAEEGGRRGAAVWAWARRGAAHGQAKVLHVNQRLRARGTPHRGQLASAARGAKAERRQACWRGVAAPQAAAKARRDGRRRVARPALPWARHSERASRPKRPLAHPNIAIFSVARLTQQVAVRRV